MGVEDLEEVQVDLVVDPVAGPVVGNGTVSFREPTDSWNQSEPRSAPPRSGKGRPSSVNVAVSSCERTCHAKFAVGPTVTARANNARARAGAGRRGSRRCRRAGA